MDPTIYIIEGTVKLLNLRVFVRAPAQVINIKSSSSSSDGRMTNCLAR